MKVGRMRYRVMFLKSTEMYDDDGNIADDWSPVCSVWADIENVNGREFFGSGQNMTEVTSKIYIRYRADINAKMRATDGERHFEIISVLGDRRSGRLTIMAKEVT